MHVKFFRVVLLLTVPVILSGCGSNDFDYRYIGLTDSMEAVEYGQTELSNVRAHSDFPIRYKLERDQYILHAIIDKRSILPTVIFSVEGKTLIDAHIRGTGVPYFLDLREIRSVEYLHYGYPSGSVRFVWNPEDRRVYGDRKALPKHKRKFTISVYDGIGKKVAEEEILFDIVVNGIHRVYDSL